MSGEGTSAQLGKRCCCRPHPPRARATRVLLMLFVPVSHRRYISRHTKRNTTHLSSRSRHTTHARHREHVVASTFTRWRVAIAVRGGTADGPGRHTKSFSTQRKRIRSATAPAKKSPPNTPTCSNKHHLGVSSTVRDARPTSEHTVTKTALATGRKHELWHMCETEDENRSLRGA